MSAPLFTNRQRKLMDSWEKWEADEPDISTEQLMHRVCADNNAEPTEVVEAMEAEAAYKAWKDI